MGNRAAILALACGLLLAACDGGAPDDEQSSLRQPRPSPSTKTDPLIALVGTMTGPDSWRGDDAYQAAHLAVYGELNRRRGPGELPFELLSADDEGDPELALELIKGYAAEPRTVGIVYAGPPEVLQKAQPLLAEAGVPGILLYEDLYSARLLRSHLFQLAPPYLWQARRLATYIGRDRGYDRVGALLERSLEGRTAGRSLRAALADRRRIRLRIERYEPGEEPALGRSLGALGRANVEALVFQGGPAAAATLFSELRERGASYVDTAAAKAAGTRRRRSQPRRRWRPQVMLFDGAMGPRLGGGIPAGTVAAESYARGAYYLPVPSFREFLTDFRGWWDSEPYGWQQRTYEGVLAVGWAARRTSPGEDHARALQTMRDERLGGLGITFGPDDHTSVEQTTIGLWVVPRPAAEVRERDRLPDSMPWVPLARGFSLDGEHIDYRPEDWRYLVRNPPPPNGPSPPWKRSRFGVVTGAKDPVH
ncbi:MAG: ABC transporter substrate-binding protein [Actinomycetota bacterium]